MVRAAFSRCLIQRRMNSDEQCLKAAKSIPHISKEQVLVRFESFWYNFGTILSESTCENVVGISVMMAALCGIYSSFES